MDCVAGGTTDDDSCEDITVDSSGNVFATGHLTERQISILIQ